MKNLREKLSNCNFVERICDFNDIFDVTAIVVPMYF